MANKKKTVTVWYVAHLIHVRTPFEHIPKLFITNVPEDKDVTWDLVDGYKSFGEFGITHANHYIDKLTKSSPASIKRAWRNGNVETISYEKLISLDEDLPD